VSRCFLLIDGGVLYLSNLSFVVFFHVDIGADVFETSSKRGYNVDKVFEKIAEDFMKSSHMIDSGMVTCL